MAAGDFNRDGREDLAAANRNSHDVSILLNTTSPPVRPFWCGRYHAAVERQDDAASHESLAPRSGLPPADVAWIRELLQEASRTEAGEQ